jgi:hypothetical protein
VRNGRNGPSGERTKWGTEQVGNGTSGERNKWGTEGTEQVGNGLYDLDNNRTHAIENGRSGGFVRLSKCPRKPERYCFLSHKVIAQRYPSIAFLEKVKFI